MKFYFKFAIVVLVFTSVAKILSSFSNSVLLAHYDPLWAMQTKHLLRLISLFELALVITLIISKNNLVKCIFITLCGAEFLLYRISIHFVDKTTLPCPCLGTIFAWIKVNPRIIEALLSSIAIYLFIGGILYSLMELKRYKGNELKG